MEIYYFLGSLVLMVLVPTLYLKYRDFRDSKSDTVVISFDAPDDLNVLEVGYFYDNKIMFKDVLGWLMEFVLKGNLEIDKRDGDVKVKVVSKPNDLNEINELVWSSFFRERKEVSMNHMLKNYNVLLLGLTMKFREDLLARGYLKKFNKVWVVVPLVLAFLVYLLAFRYLPGFEEFDGIGRIIVFGVMPFLGLLLCVTTPVRTEKGKDLYRRLAVFRDYLKTAEKDREKFRQELLTRIDEKDRRLEFSTLLPYLAVLNVDKKWFETLVPELQEFVDSEDFMGFISTYN